MKFTWVSLSKFFAAVFAVMFISSFASAGNVYQIINLNDDGSGSIKLSYSAQNRVLRANNFVLGKFVFSDKLARQNFTSPNTTVKTSRLDFDVKDSTYFVTVELDFKDFSKLNTAPGFSFIKSYWYGSDTGAVFEYVITPGSGAAKFFDALSYIVNFQSAVKSSNGVVKGNNVTWGNRSTKNTDFGKDVVFIATTSAKVSAKKQTSTPPNSTANNDQQSGNEKSAGEQKDKSCGLFGFELPLILLGGYAFALRRRHGNN